MYAPRNERKLIALEDNARYRAFYDQCMMNDDLLRPHVVFVTVDEACNGSRSSATT